MPLYSIFNSPRFAHSQFDQNKRSAPRKPAIKVSRVCDDITQAKSPRITSLSTLLKLYGVPMSPQKANKIFLEEGIILELHRRSLSQSNMTRSFKVLSNKGLHFGKNEPNPVHPMETEIHYSIEGFQALAELLMSRLPKS